MADRDDLVPGAFYWAMPALDPDRRQEWEYFTQPVRFVGRDETGEPIWQCIGMDGMTDWSMRYIGPRIISPDSEEQRIAVGNNDPDGSPVPVVAENN